MSTLESAGIKPAPDFERLKNTLLGKGSPGHIPFYELYVNTGVMEKLTGKKFKERADSIDFYYRAGYDYVPAWPNIRLKTGSLSDATKGYPVSDRESYEKYVWPKISEIDFSEFDSMHGRLPDGMKIIGQTAGVFERLEGICGYEGLCFLLCDDRELVNEILNHLEELYIAMYREMAQRDYVGAIVISDDMGYKTQTLISPDDLREFILPRHKKLADIAHEYGKPCILHSCGNLKTIMDDIIETVGIDAKHSYEDAIMPVTEAKKVYGDRITVLGGFDVDRLCRGTAEEVAEYTEYLISECGSDGNYALGSGNSIADYVPLENYLAMLKTGLRYK